MESKRKYKRHIDIKKPVQFHALKIEEDDQDAPFYLNEMFTNFDDFEERLIQYERENNVAFFKRDCRKVPPNSKSAHLKYSHVTYWCISCIKWRHTLAKLRQTPRPCDAAIWLQLVPSGEALYIKELELNHNKRMKCASLPRTMRSISFRREKMQNKLQNSSVEGINGGGGSSGNKLQISKTSSVTSDDASLGKRSQKPIVGKIMITKDKDTHRIKRKYVMVKRKKGAAALRRLQEQQILKGKMEALQERLSSIQGNNGNLELDDDDIGMFSSPEKSDRGQLRPKLNLSKAIKIQNSMLLEKAAEVLLHQSGSGIYMFKRKNDLDAILYQDREMKTAFAKYPELLLLDATCKYNILDVPLYTFFCEGNDGNTYICGFLFLLTEDYNIIEDVVKVFKRVNSSWIRMCAIMVDMDFPCRDIFPLEFENQELQICPFHVIRLITKDICSKRINIGTSEKDLVIELVSRMIGSKNEAAYNELYNKLQMFESVEFKSYFDRHWQPIKAQWVQGFLRYPITLMGARTNDKLLPFNRRVQEYLCNPVENEGIMKNLMTFLRSMRVDLEEKNALGMVPPPGASEEFEEGQPEYRYQQLLTKYAFGMVQKEIFASRSVKLLDFQVSRSQLGTFLIQDPTGSVFVVTPNHCQFCYKSTSVVLPCRHVFAVRSQLKMNLFDVALCSPRWMKSYL